MGLHGWPRDKVGWNVVGNVGRTKVGSKSNADIPLLPQSRSYSKSKAPYQRFDARLLSSWLEARGVPAFEPS